ncbi:MAG: diaminopimelate decarboxylase [Defluviitaleaceae bacterium]|nr:diaminopimelate decarboxylase [Defluviitaleaceae bacterium]
MPKSFGLNTQVTGGLNFFMGHDPIELTRRFGSPLYLYSEEILRKNCRELKNMCEYKNFRVNFSVKANTSLALMQIARQEGLYADAMSPGEICAGLAAGYDASQIFFIPNNVSDEEMRFALERGVLVSADSLSQLERLGRLNPGGDAAFRLNPGIGDGHDARVITGGDDSKFGVTLEQIPRAKEIIRKYSLRIKGINQHIGSHFMDMTLYDKSVGIMLSVARQFDGLDFIDFGGGFGIPYRKQEGEPRLDLRKAGETLDKIMAGFASEYGKELTFIVEPGRYVTAEAGILLGTVCAVKNNGDIRFVGTDIGMNVLMRPALYDSYHEIEVYSENEPRGERKDERETVSVVGNICESTDFLAKDRLLPHIGEGDVLGVLDAGSYGYSMCSNYNMRLRPAEVLLRENGEAAVIREREELEDLLRGQRMI